ncbi:L-Aspartase-like protein [Scleroderma yunnanense]
MTTLIAQFVADVYEHDQYLAGKPVVLTGSSLSLPQIAAIAQYPPNHRSLSHDNACAPYLQLTSSQDLREKVDASRAVIDDKVTAGISIYGVSTGFGGSADTRTDDPLALGAALLQHQQAGVILPSSASTSSRGIGPIPLRDPSHGTTMPIPWTRAAMLVRANSLMRGYSGIRWSLVEKMVELIQKGVVPVVPLRGTISASGDLSPLSYVAGLLIGNPAIRAWILTPSSPTLFLSPSDLPCMTISVPVPTRPTLADIPKRPKYDDTPFDDTMSSISGTSSLMSSPRSGSPIAPSTPASSLLEEDCVKPFSLDGTYEPGSMRTHTMLMTTADSMPASRALRATGTTPLPLASKEHLGVVNGTAFSAGLAALVVRNAETMVILSAVLTALAVEAMTGARGSFDPFVGKARPHVGQIEAAHLIHELLSDSRLAVDHEKEVKIEEDDGVLRQDRYSLRTAPQWLGPQFEELKSTKEKVRVEVNSTTDNPLVEPPSSKGGQGKIHHAGNFQALSMTVAMDHLRLLLAQIGRLMFVQLTEIVNPAMNRGLPGNLAGGEAALDFGGKGLDIAAASYAGELNALGGTNVGVGVVSAEMHNQSLNSLALVSARYTFEALEVSELLAASHLHILCQALDLRVMYTMMHVHTREVTRAVLSEVFGEFFTSSEILESVVRQVVPDILDELDRTTAVPLRSRMAKVAGASVAPLLEALTPHLLCIVSSPPLDVGKIGRFREVLAHKLEALLTELRCAFMGLSLDEISPSAHSLFDIPSMGSAPASRFLAPRTRILYEFVRVELGIPMSGGDNLRKTVYGMRTQDQVVPEGEFGMEEAGLGKSVDTTPGDKASMIVEAIRDGRIARVLARMCQGVDV